MPRIRPAWLLIVSTFCAGCLPSSCAREESHELFVADSLSRALASQMPIDTLVTVFDTATDNVRDRVDGPVRFEHPRTLLFDVDGTMHISDAEENEVIQLDQTGRELNRVNLQPLVGDNGIPYLVGARSDSLFVFLAGLNRFVVLRDNVVVKDFPIAPEDDRPRNRRKARPLHLGGRAHQRNPSRRRLLVARRTAAGSRRYARFDPRLPAARDAHQS